MRRWAMPVNPQRLTDKETDGFVVTFTLLWETFLRDAVRTTRD